WTAFGWKSRIRVAPCGAPGSAPPPPQPAAPTPMRAAASSAATHLIRADLIHKASIKVSRAPPAAGEFWLDCARLASAGPFFESYEEVTSSARSRSGGVRRRVAGDAAPGLLRYDCRRPLRCSRRCERTVRIRLRGGRSDPLPAAVRADHQHRRGQRRAL